MSTKLPRHELRDEIHVRDELHVRDEIHVVHQKDQNTVGTSLVLGFYHIFIETLQYSCIWMLDHTVIHNLWWLQLHNCSLTKEAETWILQLIFFSNAVNPVIGVMYMHLYCICPLLRGLTINCMLVHAPNVKMSNLSLSLFISYLPLSFSSMCAAFV